MRLGLKAGATLEELWHAALLAITTIGFPSMIRAMSWIDSDSQPKADSPVSNVSRSGANTAAVHTMAWE